MNQAAAAPVRWSRLPIFRWLPAYPPRRLPGDLLAGVIVAALAVPQALGYAGIAGVPVQVGLYAIPLACVAYAVFGSSPHLFVGPVSTVSVLSGSLVADIAHGDQALAVAATSGLAISAGIVLVIGGLARIGWAAEFLSRPIVTGFVFGLVLVIILGEIPSLLGMPVESGDALRRAWSILTHLTQLTPITAAVGVGSLAILFAGNRFLPRIPWGLVVLVGGILASSALDLAGKGVAVVGSVPTGFPPIGLPNLPLSAIPSVVTGGFAIALVGLGEGLSAARLFATQRGYTVDTNQELLATGAANAAAGLSGGLGVAGSLSKTAAAVRAGGNSQLTGLTAAVVVLLVTALFSGGLASLPRAVLSAIVIQAVWGLMDVPAFRRYKAIRRNDFVGAIAAMIGVLVLGPLYGLLAAILQAVLGLVYRSSRLDLDVMGKVPGEKAAWGAIHRHPERRTIDGILVLRLDSPLFFANATEVHDRVLATVDEQPDVRVLLLDLEATSQLDTTSIDALEQLLTGLRERDVELYLVRVFYRARKVLANAGFIEALGEDHMWHSISAGVRAARAAAHVTAKAHPQATDDDEAFGPGEERIAVDDDHDEDTGVAVGGYSGDPHIKAVRASSAAGDGSAPDVAAAELPSTDTAAPDTPAADDAGAREPATETPAGDDVPVPGKGLTQ